MDHLLRKRKSITKLCPLMTGPVFHTKYLSPNAQNILLTSPSPLIIIWMPMSTFLNTCIKLIFSTKCTLICLPPKLALSVSKFFNVKEIKLYSFNSFYSPGEITVYLWKLICLTKSQPNLTSHHWMLGRPLPTSFAVFLFSFPAHTTVWKWVNEFTSISICTFTHC